MRLPKLRLPKLFLMVWLALAATVFCSRPSTAQGQASAQAGSTQALRAKQEQLFALTNQARAAAGLRPVRWDPALAAAALNHCLRMAAEGPISHRYGGEPDLTERAAQAGAHFSLIEENIAVGSYVATIHQGWLDSPGHRANLLSPEVDSVGIALVASGGVLYAVADYGRTVEMLAPNQVEAAVSRLIQASGVAMRIDPSDARAACGLDRGLPRSLNTEQPQFVMRWQDADLSRLPAALQERLVTGRYRKFAVGSCPAQSGQRGFTIYRVAVLLY